MPTNISFALLCHCKVMTIRVNEYFVAQMTSWAVRYDVIYHLYQLLTIVNLRNRTGEERRRQTLCDERDNNFV